MNAIAAHKDELKKLLANLSHDTAVSGMGFAALLDAYITRVETDYSDVRELVDLAKTRAVHWVANDPRLTTPAKGFADGAEPAAGLVSLL
jgi:hypothetical protein